MMGELREQLAKLAHEQWSGWMQYLFSKGTFQENGAFIIPAPEASRWGRQMKTPYVDLPSDEQDSDRAEADKFLAAIREYLPAHIDPVPDTDETED